MSLSPFQRKFYQKNPDVWLRDRLGIPHHTIKWSLNPSYKTKGYITEEGEYVKEKWDGTPDPFVSAGKALVDWKDCGLESATGTGKTFWAAGMVLWFLDVWGDEDDPSSGCVVMTLAPKEDQLKKNLWKEISTLWPKFQQFHPTAELLSLEIRMRPDRQNWMAFGYPVGVGAEEQAATRAAGFHAPHMLIILEETPGLPNPVLEALDNTCTAPHNLRLALGNPDSVTDTLHQFCSFPTTVGIRISGFDAPNVVEEDADVIPGAVSAAAIERRLLKYGDDHPLYQSRVRGICPDVSNMCLFNGATLATAENRLKDPLETLKVKSPSEGEVRIYFEPTFTHINRYLIFADVAGDSGRGDYHAGIVFDRLKKRPAAVIHMRGPREDYITMLLELADRYKIPWTDMIRQYHAPVYFHPLLAWERVGVGALIMDQRIKEYPNLYQKRSLDVLNPNVQATIGWDTTSKSRKVIVDELESWGLELREYPDRMVDRELLNECRTFVWIQKGRSGRYEHASGHYDDLVMALGGCLVIDKLIPPPRLQEKPPEHIQTIQDPFFRRAIERSTGFNNGDSWTSNKQDTWSQTKIPHW